MSYYNNISGDSYNNELVSTALIDNNNNMNNRNDSVTITVSASPTIPQTAHPDQDGVDQTGQNDNTLLIAVVTPITITTPLCDDSAIPQTVPPTTSPSLSNPDPEISPTISEPPLQVDLLPGIVDLAVPRYFTSSIRRETMLAAQPPLYTRETFNADFTSNRSGCCPPCPEFTFALLGLVGVCGVIAGGALFAIKTDYKYVLLALGVAFWLLYSMFFLCSSPVCNTCCAVNDNPLDLAWFQSVYKGYDDTAQDTIDAIDQLSTDVPRLLLNVQCSHMSGSKNKRRVVTYNQNCVIPIVAYRNLAPDHRSFLTSLDSVHRGEVLINYVPKLILHPDQIETLAKAIKMVTKQNEKRDSTCIVTPILSTVNPKIIVAESNDGMFWDSFKQNGDPDDANYTKPSQAVYNSYHFNNHGNNLTNDGRITLKIQTSLGQFMSVYESDQGRTGFCPRWCTHRAGWTLGAYLGLMTCNLVAWYNRFRKATFTVPFYLLLPDFAQYEAAYLANPDSFVIEPNDKTPPVVQTPPGQPPVEFKIGPSSDNTVTNGPGTCS